MSPKTLSTVGIDRSDEHKMLWSFRGTQCGTHERLEPGLRRKKRKEYVGLASKI